MIDPRPLSERLLPQRVLRLLRATRRYHKPLAFLGGFLWDLLALKRIDSLFANVRLSAYLLLLGLLLIVDLRTGYHRPPLRWFETHRGWLQLGIQFFFGGLFSAYVVFYLKSTSLGPPLLFMGLLVALFGANEFLDRHIRGHRLELALYWFCAFSFLLFLVPVLTGWLGFGVFLIAGLLAVGVAAAVTAAASGPAPGGAGTALRRNVPVWAAFFVLLGVLYQLGVIPPVPLSLTHAGVYHQIERTGDMYHLTYESPSWYRFWVRSDEIFRQQEGDQACCFSAVFAPTGTEFTVRHRWQWLSPQTGDWQDTDRIAFRARGGRGAGYRGFTCKSRVAAGHWRVRVENDSDQELGRVNFIAAPAGPGSRDWSVLEY